MRRLRFPVNSLKFKLLSSFLFVWILIFIALSIHIHITQDVIVSEIKNTYKNMLDLYVEQFNSQCTDINRNLASNITFESSNEALNIYSSDGSYNEDIIEDILSDDVLLYGGNFSFFFCNPSNDTYIYRTSDNVTLNERNVILNYLEFLPNNFEEGKWLTSKINERYFLFRAYKKDDYYLGTWISLENALKLYGKNNFPEDALLIFSNEGSPIIMPEGINLSSENITAEYLSLSSATDVDGLSLEILIPYKTIYSSLFLLKIFQFLILIFIFLTAPYIIYDSNKALFKPLKKLTASMDKLQHGDFNVTLENEQFTKELDVVIDSFNKMTHEISNLKIGIYEQKLYAQSLELEKLQQQLKPHFYLNCLNIINNLAQAKEYELIQELSLAQAKYFRYMLKSSFTLVSIKEELDHIENYLHIQQLRFPGRLKTELYVHNSLFELKIPPLTLQIFIENIIKHALINIQELKISICVNLEDESHVKIEITDNGIGFSTEILKKYENQNHKDYDEGQNIGILNTMRRLDLYYKGDSKILLSNNTPHGAIVNIIIPNTQNSGDEQV